MVVTQEEKNRRNSIAVEMKNVSSMEVRCERKNRPRCIRDRIKKIYYILKKDILVNFL